MNILERVRFNNLSWKQKVLLYIFILGLIYVMLPGPQSINNFPGLPGSAKSDFPGDTTQNPNISAYFTDYRRNEITKFYKSYFSKQLMFGIPLPIISLNHPPEAAYRYVRDQQESTFLEEYIFPLRESIYVNGYEPTVRNDIFKIRDRSFIGDHEEYKGTYYNTKTTLRFYPSPFLARVVVYLAIWLCGFWLLQLYKKLWREEWLQE